MSEVKNQFVRVESLEQFPRAERLQMTLNLMTKNLTTSYQGRDASEEEVYTALWRYHGALNQAERQINQLLKIIEFAVVDKGMDDDDSVYDYEEEYQEDGGEKERYNIDEVKAALFGAIHKKDDKATGRLINQLIMLEEKREEATP